MTKFKSFKANTYFAFGSIIFISLILLLTVFRLFSILKGLKSYIDNVTLKRKWLRRKGKQYVLFNTRSGDFTNDNKSIYAANIDSLQECMINEIGVFSRVRTKYCWYFELSLKMDRRKGHVLIVILMEM